MLVALRFARYAALTIIGEIVRGMMKMMAG
jgi:hypothetical protein